MELLRAFAALAVIGMPLAHILWTLFGARKEGLPSGFHERIIALEPANSAQEAKDIIENSPHRDSRTKLRNAVSLDFLIIAIYWLFFLTLSVLLP